MKKQQRHDVGYWMSVIGFAVFVSITIFGPIASLESGSIAVLTGLSFLMFLLGAEMALRNGRHGYPFHHNEN